MTARFFLFACIVIMALGSSPVYEFMVGQKIHGFGVREWMVMIRQAPPEGILTAILGHRLLLGWLMGTALLFSILLIKPEDHLRFRRAFRAMAALGVFVAGCQLSVHQFGPSWDFWFVEDGGGDYAAPASVSYFWLLGGADSSVILVNALFAGFALILPTTYVMGRAIGYRVHLERAWFGLLWFCFTFFALQIGSRVGLELIFEARFGYTYELTLFQVIYLFVFYLLIYAVCFWVIAMTICALRPLLFSHPA